MISRKFQVPTGKIEFFEWFSDFSHYPSLFPHVISIMPVSDKTGGKGEKIYEERAKNFLGKEENIKIRIIEWIENKKIIVEATKPRMVSIFSFEFLDLDANHSEWIWEMYVKKKSFLPAPIFRFLLKLLFQKRLNYADFQLKNIFPKN